MRQMAASGRGSVCVGRNDELDEVLIIIQPEAHKALAQGFGRRGGCSNPRLTDCNPFCRELFSGPSSLLSPFGSLPVIAVAGRDV